MFLTEEESLNNGYYKVKLAEESLTSLAGALCGVQSMFAMDRRSFDCSYLAASHTRELSGSRLLHALSDEAWQRRRCDVVSYTHDAALREQMDADVGVQHVGSIYRCVHPHHPSCAGIPELQASPTPRTLAPGP